MNENERPEHGRPLRLIFAAGGTAGHINPALSLARAMSQRYPDAAIRFCGTEDGLEKKMVERAGYPFDAIDASPFKRDSAKALLKATIDLARGYRACRTLIERFRPDAVVGTGGYVCAPLMAAAKKAGVPRLIHEQNAFAGRSNKAMGKGADVVCISFEESRRFFPRAKRVVLTGNPVPDALFHMDRDASRTKLGISLERGRKLVLVTGGSLGARRLNEGILAYAKDLHARASGGEFAASQLPKIILAAGSRLYEEMEGKNAGIEDLLEIKPYLYDMPDYLAAADLVVSRAGAITCAEIAATGRASILVPYPFAADDHQSFNAAAFVAHGAALLCKDAEFTVDWLHAALTPLIRSDDRLAEMGRRAEDLAAPQASDRLCDELERLAKRNGTARSR